MRFKRNCKKCNKIFQPLGKFQTLCVPCNQSKNRINGRQQTARQMVKTKSVRRKTT